MGHCLCRGWPRSFATLVVATLLLEMGSGGAVADGGMRIVSNSHTLEFAEAITYNLALEMATPVTEVTLYYRREGEGVTVRVPIELVPGESSFTYTWELEPGTIPVGEPIEYEWRVRDEAGTVLQTEPLTFVYADDRFDWRTEAEGSILLHWYGPDSTMAGRLLGYATAAISRLQDEVGVDISQPIEIYVYNTKSDMSLTLPRKSEAYDERILTLGVVVDDATLLLLGSHEGVEGTIAHELSHIVVGLATENPYVDLPRWLDEGLAMYAEGELPAINRRALEAAVKSDGLISVRSLSAYTGDPEQVDLFYGEAYSLVDFLLRKYYDDKMAQLLDVFVEGISQEEALMRVYGFGIDELDAKWRQSLGLMPRRVASEAVPTAAPPDRPRSVCPWTWLASSVGLVGYALVKKHARAA